jgi:hypothetical protein
LKLNSEWNDKLPKRSLRLHTVMNIELDKLLLNLTQKLNELYKSKIELEKWLNIRSNMLTNKRRLLSKKLESMMITSQSLKKHMLQQLTNNMLILKKKFLIKLRKKLIELLKKLDNPLNKLHTNKKEWLKLRLDLMLLFMNTKLLLMKLKLLMLN